ncbi:MAG TPA: CinA family nicotinamide mononucleotide deamidase-related protein [Candidatus Hydrogenedens sp.]|nr:CinA family nicotinamide mononucleotide deamidase-related protein [Candidatus Hydrogenedens sp.]
MKAELVMIGTELLLGQIIDTNAAYLGRRLSEIGVDVYRKVTVGDNQDRIVDVIKESLSRCDVVICSGGLGPTVDDITRESISEATDSPLVYHPALYQEIFERLERKGIKVSENNKKQAMLPKGAVSIPNRVGTAPGIIKEYNSKYIISLPGVPFELEPMFEESVVPFLRKTFQIESRLYIRVLKVYGLGESRVDYKLGELLYSSSPTIGLLASPECVQIRLAVKGESSEKAEEILNEMEHKIHNLLPGIVLSGESYSLEKALDKVLMQNNKSIAVFDGQSGGMIIYRMFQARMKSFIHGEVFPNIESSQDLEKLFDRANKNLLEFPFVYNLILYSNPKDRVTHLILKGNNVGEIHWELPFYGTEERDRVRISVVSLEQVRRKLLSIEFKDD